jgi:hypothetical protein
VTDKPQKITIVFTEEARRSLYPCEEHGHRWAHAMLVRGGTRQVCRTCGRERGIR